LQLVAAAELYMPTMQVILAEAEAVALAQDLDRIQLTLVKAHTVKDIQAELEDMLADSMYRAVVVVALQKQDNQV
jgi:hypothetical protein